MDIHKKLLDLLYKNKEEHVGSCFSCIDYLDKIIISDSDKISNFSKTTNQLIIENADSILNNFIFSFFIPLPVSLILKTKFLIFLVKVSCIFLLLVSEMLSIEF